ncbi:hypothetical protein [Phenylobacterium sp.]|uniref:hypothetical protein n=1 Tax=Phenylobacterium sp. TaxID=1871053 RepID=UPI00260090F6|nr:hypothetical protein [Phenylobacterium sp.]
MGCHRLKLIALSAAMVLAAGAASAQTAALDEVKALTEAVRPSGDLAKPHASVAARYDRDAALRAAGIARTSVDRRLASDDLTGSLGFLCGLQPGAERSGAAAVRGYDPSGRFVGAKLSLAFK